MESSRPSTREVIIWGLGIAGVLVSFVVFVPWFTRHGFDPVGGWVEAFTGDSFGTGFIYDLAVTTVMLFVLTLWDREILGWRWVAFIIASTMSGAVSIGFAAYVCGLARRGASPGLIRRAPG